MRGTKKKKINFLFPMRKGNDGKFLDRLIMARNLGK